MTYLVLDYDLGIEKLYINGKLAKTYLVNIGRIGEPTPKHSCLNISSWKLTHATDSHSRFGHFIYLDIPYQNRNNGPIGYMDGDIPAYWTVSGPFGLHKAKINKENIRTSSGCVRHDASDILELYEILVKLGQWPYDYYIV